MVFGCVVPFKRKKKKIPDLSLPPCTWIYGQMKIGTEMFWQRQDGRNNERL
jgi:hypothetical protein